MIDCPSPPCRLVFSPTGSLPASTMINAVLLLSPEALEWAYPEPVLAQLRSQVATLSVFSPAETWRAEPGILAEADVLFSGWGAPLIDDDFLRQAPRLKAVFYAGGSVRYFVTPALWQRGIRLTTAQSSNAIPVAEFTVASLVLGLKRAWHYARLTRQTRGFPPERPMPGAYRTTIGLVSYGVIARLVRQKLREFEVNVVVYDPLLTGDEAQAEGVAKVSLDELFARADAVSVHTPHLAKTTGMIRGRHFEALRPGAFFLNTARGEVVNEVEMISVLRRRPDLQAVLDVTAPEPPAPDSPLYTLPNVVLTPHLAGSIGAECERLGQAVVDDFLRYRKGEPLKGEINAERAAVIA